MIFDLDLWSLQILGIQHLAGRFLLGIGTPYNAFWNSPTLGLVFSYAWPRHTGPEAVK